ncbi:gcn5-related n-acetyltransferase [Grosmannia clavigera kw1407]|uniref:Gcn5-related n-acetyltransferase n=1 Tax=Grosmannia clavigera (strain kw1407 / UAMH 11150) TaxID=655863 RepID=F0XT51_GROCL|nr:gcn5-related n-acetyltransferase [Grosmannia clavigera kw1407]EFW99180.1 gcn5-related n-acetyltransferase [Grosmannia clavigera kw1407]
MASVKSQLRDCSWKKTGFLVSTDPNLVPVSTLVDIFASGALYWAKPLPSEAMQEILENSLVFGLYEQLAPGESAIPSSELKVIGLARCVTDYTTFSYLTDVWISPEYQGKGLGRWLIGCIRETFENLPHMRRSILFTGDWERSVPFYEKFLDMTLVETKHGEGLALMESKGKGHPAYGLEGNGYN